MAKLSHIQDGQKLSHQIFQTLIAFIQENKLSNGERLPSQTLLAEQLNVSRTSLREALAQLQMGGIIKHKHGEGTFVTCNPDEIMTKTDISFNTSEMIEAQGITPNTSEVVISLVVEKDVDHVYKDRLNLSEGEQLTRIERVRTGDDVPFAYVITYSSFKKVHLDLESEIYRGSYQSTSRPLSIRLRQSFQIWTSYLFSFQNKRNNPYFRNEVKLECLW